MGKTYIVREGKVRGEGRYLTGNTSQSVADWGAVGDAWEYLGRLTASADADRHGGRVVRVVSLRERLRRAKKRIAELTDTRASVTVALEDSYKQGRADERKAVVEWLRKEPQWQGHSAKCIEEGKHAR